LAKIGKLTISLLISSEEEEKELIKKINSFGYKICIGKVGTMKSSEIIAAIETAAKREGIFCANNYRGEHSLYHTEWISVGIYGMIGAPIKGFEHEAIGLEINTI